MKKERLDTMIEMVEFFLALFAIVMMIYELVVYYAYFFCLVFNW